MACKFTVQELCDVLDINNIDLSDSSMQITGVGTDSRSDLANKLFVPLIGDNFDAHDFISAAVENGAAVVLSHNKNIKNIKVPVLFVKDTLLALQKLANYWRVKNKFKVLAISGSNGKTTAKEFVKSILSNHYKLTASRASFNNHWGVPITILSADKNDEILILEMGMNHLGELKILSEIAQQDVSVLTTIGHAHVGEVGSFESIVKAKKELYDFSPSALHIFNLDNKETFKMYSQSSNEKKLSFSNINPEADVYLTVKAQELNRILITGTIGKTKGEVWAPTFGQHNVYNIMVAACLSMSCGLAPEKIWQGIEGIEGAWGRNEIINSNLGFKVLFDAYNANPESVMALHNNIKNINHSGNTFFVFGDMLEMGKESQSLHLEIIKDIKKDYQGLWYIGEHAEAVKKELDNSVLEGHFFVSKKVDEQIASKLLALLKQDDLLLMKGSRGMGLESILKLWNIPI